MPKDKQDSRQITITCTLPGHEDDWIKFETVNWTLADMREMYSASYEEAIIQWIEKDTLAWHLTGDDNKVVEHPGRGATPAQWLAVYRHMGQEGFVLRQWLGFAPYRAALELTRPDTKSSLSSAGLGQDE